MIPTLSYSQLDSFRDCPRKWAWRTLDRVEGEENQAAAFGVRTHKQIENHLRHGSPLDLTTPEGEVAMSGYHLWPREVVGWLSIEEAFTVEIAGFPFKGVKDLRYVDPENPLEPVIADHKTTSDFRYAKTEAELEIGLQSNIYAEHEFQTTPAESVRLRWLYYRTKGTRKSHEVNARILRDSPVRLAILDEIAKDAATMTDLRQRGYRALDLPPNPLACDKYGGCSYRSLCNLSDIERFKAAMSNSSEILARLQGQISGANPPAPPGAPPAPPTQQPNPGMRFAFIQPPGQPGGWAEVPIGMPIPNEVQFGAPPPAPPPQAPMQYPPQAPAYPPAPPAPPQAPAYPPAPPQPPQEAPAPKRARKSKDESSDACSAAVDALVGRAAAPGVPASEALMFAQAAETISRIGK